MLVETAIFFIFHMHRRPRYECPCPNIAITWHRKTRMVDHTIRYDSVYLTCSKKLTGSQLSPPHRTNKKLKCETKNKTMSMIGLVLSVVMKAVR